VLPIPSYTKKFKNLVSWFAGSVVIGILYDHSIAAMIGFCVVLPLASIPLFVTVHRRTTR